MQLWTDFTHYFKDLCCFIPGVPFNLGPSYSIGCYKLYKYINNLELTQPFCNLHSNYTVKDVMSAKTTQRMTYADNANNKREKSLQLRSGLRLGYTFRVTRFRARLVFSRIAYFHGGGRRAGWGRSIGATRVLCNTMRVDVYRSALRRCTAQCY